MHFGDRRYRAMQRLSLRVLCGWCIRSTWKDGNFTWERPTKATVSKSPGPARGLRPAKPPRGDGWGLTIVRFCFLLSEPAAMRQA